MSDNEVERSHVLNVLYVDYRNCPLEIGGKLNADQISHQEAKEAAVISSFNFTYTRRYSSVHGSEFLFMLDDEDCSWLFIDERSGNKIHSYHFSSLQQFGRVFIKHGEDLPQCITLLFANNEYLRTMLLPKLK